MKLTFTISEIKKIIKSLSEDLNELLDKYSIESEQIIELCGIDRGVQFDSLIEYSNNINKRQFNALRLEISGFKRALALIISFITNQNTSNAETSAFTFC